MFHHLLSTAANATQYHVISLENEPSRLPFDVPHIKGSHPFIIRLNLHGLKQDSSSGADIRTIRTQEQLCHFRMANLNVCFLILTYLVLALHVPRDTLSAHTSTPCDASWPTALQTPATSKHHCHKTLYLANWYRANYCTLSFLFFIGNYMSRSTDAVMNSAGCGCT